MSCVDRERKKMYQSDMLGEMEVESKLDINTTFRLQQWITVSSGRTALSRQSQSHDPLT